MAYTKTVWKDYPDTTTKITADELNNIEDGIETNDIAISGGWISANETWTYASVDDPTGVITISGNVTTKYSLGMRIKFTNGGNVIYGIITAISYSSPNTTMTFLHEIDPTDSLALHLMASSAITNNYYSNVKAPFGFPLSADKWSVVVTDTTNRAQTSATALVWYNIGGVSISIPIGSWNVSYDVTAQIAAAATPTADKYLNVTLGTTASNDDPTFTSSSALTGEFLRINNIKQNTVNVATKQTRYLNTMSSSGVHNLHNLNGSRTLVLRAVCTYL